MGLLSVFCYFFLLRVLNFKVGDPNETLKNIRRIIVYYYKYVNDHNTIASNG